MKPFHVLGLFVIVLLLFGSSPNAEATLPGKNGPLLVDAQEGPLPVPPGPMYVSHLYHLALDGSHSEITAPESNYDPAISPDGTKLAFIRNPGDQLWLGDVSKVGSATAVTTGDDYSGDYRSTPVFTPDGKSVILDAGWSYKGWYDSEIQSYSLKSGVVTPRAHEGDVQMSPDVSPDGKMIAFVSAQFVDYSFQSLKIRLANGFNAASRPFPASGPAWGPSFSPDGRKLAYLGEVNGVAQVFVGRIDGTHQRQLTFGSDPSLKVVFSPDGKKIAYASGDPHAPRITVRNLRSGTTTSVDFPGVAGTLSQWPRSELFKAIRFKPNRRQLVVRVFNPGTVVVLARGKRLGRRTVSAGGTYRVGIRWKGRSRKRRVRIEFRPVGALPGSIRYVLRR